MTDEQRAAYIRGLVKERAGAAQYGRADRVAAIDVELARLGVDAAPPAKRAAKRAKAVS